MPSNQQINQQEAAEDLHRVRGLFGLAILMSTLMNPLALPFWFIVVCVCSI